MAVCPKRARRRRAKRIIALQDGVIAESGAHDELLRRGGVYSAFRRLQFHPGAI
jgi:ATP-binding cassette subfamily B protein